MSHDFFHGYAMNAVDAKSRLSIPAAYREVIELRGGGRAVVLAPHEREPCLIGYDRGYSARLQQRLERQFDNDFGTDRDDFARRAFGTSELVPYDDNGRIILSGMLKELGEIEKLAFFIAAGDYFEIWNPQVLLEIKGDKDPRLARIVKRQLEAKGGAA